MTMRRTRVTSMSRIKGSSYDTRRIAIAIAIIIIIIAIAIIAR